MSILNITGEEADPVRGFLIREVSEMCRKRNESDRVSKEDLERQKRDERMLKNKEWRQRRAASKRDQANTELSWQDEPNDSNENKASKCEIL